MLLPRLLGSGRLQLLQVLELRVQLVHTVGLALVGHLVLLQKFKRSLAALEPLHDLTKQSSQKTCKAKSCGN